MDEPIINPMIRELHKRLGHGGFGCAITKYGAAYLTCGVPKHRCKISLYAFEDQILHKIHIPAILVFYESSHKVYDPNFDPDKMLDDVIEVIKFTKKNFAMQKKAKLKQFPARAKEAIKTMWDVVGTSGQDIMTLAPSRGRGGAVGRA